MTSSTNELLLPWINFKPAPKVCITVFYRLFDLALKHKWRQISHQKVNPLVLEHSWLGHRLKIYRIISTLIHKVFIILHIYYILTWIDHVVDIPHVIWARIDSSQDFVLRADLSDHTRDVHNKIYSLIGLVCVTLLALPPSGSISHYWYQYAGIPKLLQT